MKPSNTSFKLECAKSYSLWLKDKKLLSLLELHCFLFWKLFYYNYKI